MDTVENYFDTLSITFCFNTDMKDPSENSFDILSYYCILFKCSGGLHLDIVICAS